MYKITTTTVIVIFLLGMLLPENALSQSPEKMSYQSVIRNATGDLVSESLVGLQISILQGSAVGVAEYIETHSVTTNVNGLASLEIGMGSVVLGTFSDIDWSNGPYFIKTEVDPSGGVSYSMSGTTELLSVPYSLHSSTSGDNQWSESGTGINTWNNNVGINSGNPQHTLDVRSTSPSDASGLNISNSDRSRYVRFFSGSDMFSDPSMSWAPGQSLLFATFDDNTFDFQEKMRISNAGNVGIGIDDPQARLDIHGGDWNLDAGNPGDLRIGNETNNFRIGIATGGGGAGITRMYTNSNSLLLGVNNEPYLIMDQDGRITAPSLTNSLIDNGGNKSLVTKEYIDATNTSSVTKTINYHPESFRPPVETTETYYIANGMIRFNTGDSNFKVPITLPVGSVINEIVIYVKDVNMDYNLWIQLYRATTYVENISLVSIHTNGSPGNHGVTIPGNFVVSSDTSYSIFVSVTVGHLWDSNTLGIYGMSVTYTE